MLGFTAHLIVAPFHAFVMLDRVNVSLLRVAIVPSGSELLLIRVPFKYHSGIKVSVLFSLVAKHVNVRVPPSLTCTSSWGYVVKFTAPAASPRKDRLVY